MTDTPRVTLLMIRSFTTMCAAPAWTSKPRLMLTAFVPNWLPPAWRLVLPMIHTGLVATPECRDVSLGGVDG